MNSAASYTCEELVLTPNDKIIGELTSACSKSGFNSQLHSQTEAWREQIVQLRSAALQLIERTRESRTWTFFLEYEISRRGKRIDAVLVAGPAILVLEFKTGASVAEGASLWQVTDYALDLRDFHEYSSGRPIFPILVSRHFDGGKSWRLVSSSVAAGAMPAVFVRPGELAEAILASVTSCTSLELPAIEAVIWGRGAYRPTLSIIEAAEEIFAGHQVREIAHAVSDNLTLTTGVIVDAVCDAQSKRKRLACFVTGIPGAGKTLTGLSAVHDPALRKDGRPAAIFLSGNGPLVRIVTAALKRDLKRRGEYSAQRGREVSTFIQNVHTFLNEYGLDDDGASPPERVVIFDEAQRAWDAEQMGRKGRGTRSEPEMMLTVMEKCGDWCVLVALVGSGQEIHRGEAGLAEWGRALATRIAAWEVMASPEILHPSEDRFHDRLTLDTPPANISLREEKGLHLATNIRSIRSSIVSEWVSYVLAAEPERAAELLSANDEFPLFVTRDRESARTWLRSCGGSEKIPGMYGLVASSGARRLRADGIEVSTAFSRSYPFEEWFLSGLGDVRSSQQLEVAATEFECQGLELDWVGVCWGDDFTFDESSRAWRTRSFTGTSWKNIRDTAKRGYLINKYRVLLTRARRGMVIWIPLGNPNDPTRKPEFLDQTAEFLRKCGVNELPDGTEITR